MARSDIVWAREMIKIHPDFLHMAIVDEEMFEQLQKEIESGELVPCENFDKAYPPPNKPD